MASSETRFTVSLESFRRSRVGFFATRGKYRVSVAGSSSPILGRHGLTVHMPTE
jgi:hypothetical protein